MGNVTLSIGGRSFTLATAHGEEAHVSELGALISEKAAASGAAGQTETRMLLFAALMLADELHGLRQRVTQEEAPPPPALSPEVTERLARIASRIENVASLLESDAPSD